MKRFALLAATVAVAGFLAACSLVELGGREEATGGTSTTQVDNPDEASQALQELAVSEPGSMSGYSRESFKHWSRANDFGWDAPQDSCNAREAALIRDGEGVEVDSGCKVTSGSWYDPYTDQTFTAPSDIDTDHVVPLANAWRSGASSWTDEERERYANDPDVLLSVEDNANQEGGQGPRGVEAPQRGGVVLLCRALDLDQGQVRSQREPQRANRAGRDAQYLRVRKLDFLAHTPRG